MWYTTTLQQQTINAFWAYWAPHCVGIVTDCWRAYLTLQVQEKVQLIQCQGMNGRDKCRMIMDESDIIKLLVFQTCNSLTTGQHMCGVVGVVLLIVELWLAWQNDKEREQRFKESMLENFVQSNPRCKWCPAPGCQYALMLHEVSGEGNEAVVCKCGHRFW
jgi:hypothetical protein